MKKLLTIICLLWSQLAIAHTANYINIEGTNLSMEAPPGFVYADEFVGFESPSTQSYIIFTEDNSS